MIPLLLALTCIPIDSPKLAARHMAEAVPAFAQLDPITDLGYAPVPGIVRVFRADQIQSLGARHGIAIPATTTDVCFEWPMRSLEAAEVEAAMRKSLPPDAVLNVVDFTRARVPRGELEFALEGLSGSTWRGRVRYAKESAFDIWARVEVRVKQTRVVTARAVQAGQILQPEDLHADEFEGIPQSEQVADLNQLIGMAAKRALPAGTALRMTLVDTPVDVKRGDLVRLHATVGRAHVATAANAQAQGKVGDVIPVKSAATGRVLRARIEAPGEVRLAQ